MKTIKINFIGFWNDFDPKNNLFYKILSERYNIEISDRPDFLFCSPLGTPYDYMQYDCVRIFFTGEYISPDFVLFDYALAFDYIDFGDRYMRYPLSLWRNKGECTFREPLTEEAAINVLHNKSVFCNYVYGHESQTKKREQLLDALNAYKRVEIAGTHLNNQPDGHAVHGEGKFELVKQSKFTVCAESVEYPGFTTEKIVHGFDGLSIPIYYGDPLVSKMFNPKAFINCADFDNHFDEVVERVREIDSNDNLFIEMMMQPITTDPDYCHNQYQLLQKFLFNIFDQDPKDAYRRMRYFRSKEYERFAKDYAHIQSSMWYRISKKLHLI